jgi:hypothetical protein
MQENSDKKLKVNRNSFEPKITIVKSEKYDEK